MALLLCPGSEEDGWITLPSSDRVVASERLKPLTSTKRCSFLGVGYKQRQVSAAVEDIGFPGHKAGFCAIKQSAKFTDEGHEIVFWEKHLLGYGTPKILQRTVLVSILPSEVSSSSTTSCLNISAVCL